MTRETDRDLAAKLKAKLASEALRGEKTLEELATEFNRIDEWTRDLDRNSGFTLPRSDTSPGAAPAAPNRPMPARLPTPPQARPATLRRPRPPTLRTAGPPTLRKTRPPTLPAATCERPIAPTLPARSRVPTLPLLPAFDLPQALLKWAVRPKSPALPKAIPEAVLEDDYWAEQSQQVANLETGGGADVGAARPSRNRRSPLWLRRFLGLFFVGWREKRHVARIARELLQLHAHVAAAHPGLKRHELYRQVVMARQGGTLADADEILERTAESYAMWPVERPLTFRDVVHYMAVSDYLASNDGIAAWTHQNMGRVVASLVPDDL
jgi:hypothetical protein